MVYQDARRVKANILQISLVKQILDIAFINNFYEFFWKDISKTFDNAFCYFVLHLTMCFRATAGALVSQGGRAPLQAQGLWIEQTLYLL